MVGVSEIQSQPRLMSSPTGSSLARHDEDELNLQGVRAMTEPEQQLVLLCEQFARELPLIILPAWRALSSRAESDSDSESKCQPRRPATVRLGVRCPAAAWQCPSHC
jgi:hypothetical protein